MRRLLALIGAGAAIVLVAAIVWIYGFGRVVETPEPREVTARVPPAPRATARGSNRLTVPVVGTSRGELFDTFTQTRALGASRHDAIDIMAPIGTPVVAAAPGTVEKLFRSDDGGNTIYVRSRDRRMIYYYAHLDRYARGLREGMRVVAGTPLGTVGWTGNADASAPHLHFAAHRAEPDESWWQGRAVNPYPLLTARR